ncbi:glucose 1-dehydrogenase [Terriglobus sp. RCC_193]|uniref:glucose 1-dehydrogenase n=1 Tax=Terriglobus sp. RCC_193 TaxID=3239218 RepID=UPI003526024F
MGNRLDGRVAIVTGASKGIGAGIARALALAGASVVVNYASDKEKAEALVTEIKAAGGNAVAARADISKAAEAQTLVNTAIVQFGRLDILVNNSGVYAFAPLGSISEEHFHRHYDINVLGPILVTQAAIKHLPAGGSIINIGSGVSRITPPHSTVYTGTKAAIDAHTGVWARELGPRQIRVNSINPGLVETEGTHAGGFIGSEHETFIANQAPLGRTGKVSDIAPLAVFLASDESGWLTGEVLIASGGVR